ncbi:hypothetical protein [Roseateles asaccharophilus]|uniref:hypothetical protein n=1 Tax=Roseateles asaccharophilus TaxID=582607 RepID=UPI00384C6AB4
MAALNPSASMIQDLQTRYAKLAKNGRPSDDWAVSTTLKDVAGNCDRYELVTQVRPNSGFPESVRYVMAVLDVDGNILAVNSIAE